MITVTYNCVKTLPDAMKSVQSQNYASVEHVVVDGGSTDGTVDLLYQNSDRLGAFVSEPDGGIYDALNKGIAMASGDIVGFLHADDIYSSHQVLADVAVAFCDPSIHAVYGDFQYVSADNL